MVEIDEVDATGEAQAVAFSISKEPPTAVSKVAFAESTINFLRVVFMLCGGVSVLLEG
jgi:hypothetical protein